MAGGKKKGKGGKKNIANSSRAIKLDRNPPNQEEKEVA